MVDEKLLPPCGLFCGVCSIQAAYRDNNTKLIEKLSRFYGVPSDQIVCEGCKSDNVFIYCRVCPILSCTAERNLNGCHECDDFPCEHIENFPIEIGKRVILRTVPQRRALGTEKWLEAEIERYKCPSCGAPLYRGFPRCGKCKQPVAPD
ncbi:MAG TPA: DUF3795 domain-containing protein [bacterium]|nr:DUF3795 domain-containing protein [bacterium]